MDAGAYNQEAYGQPGGIDVAALGRMLRRRWPLGLLAFVSIVVAVSVYTSMQERVYEAEVTLMIGTEQRARGASDFAALEQFMGSGLRSVETQRVMLANPALYKKAAEALEIDTAEFPDEFGVKVEAPEFADMLILTVSDTNPQRAADFANKVAEIFIKENETGTRNAARRAIEFIDKQLAETRKQILSTESQLRDYRQEHGIVDLPSEVSARTTAVNTLRSSAASAAAERAAASSQAAHYRSELGKVEDRVIQSTSIARNPIIGSIEGRISELELERAQQATTRGPEHAEIKKLDEQIAAARAELADAVDTIVSGEQEIINPVHSEFYEAIADAEAAALAAGARESALNAALSGEKERLAQLPGFEAELAALTMDSIGLERMYTILLERKQEFSIQEEATPPVAEVISAAERPRAPVRPRRSLNLAIGVVLGLILAALAIGLVETLDDAPRTSWQAQDALGLSCLADVPKVRPGSELLIGKSVHAGVVDAYGALRTNLRLATAGGMPRSIMVTGAQLGAGATTTAANLAVALARSGHRVVAVDANLRDPQLHEKLGIVPGDGLVDVLAGAAPATSDIVATQERNLWFLAAGSQAPSPVDLLDSEAMKNTMRSLMDQFDAIVIDSPSPEEYSDPIVLAPTCDATLLVILIGRSPLRIAQAEVRKLEWAGRRPIGFVSNAIRR